MSVEIEILEYLAKNKSSINYKGMKVGFFGLPDEESKKKEREWFLRHLKRFDYIMIQKSVWVGPSPLPKDFLNYVKSIGLSNKLRTLKLAKPYSAGDRDM